MKKYLVYELKKNLFTIGCLTLVATVLYVLPLIISRSIDQGAFYTLVWIISTIGGVMAGVVPVWIFSYKMKKRSVDLYFSLPLSHTKILLTKFLIGLIAVFVPYTVAYWLGAFTVMGKFAELQAVGYIPQHFAMLQAVEYLPPYPQTFQAVWYIPQYFASLIPIYIIYSISAFVFTRANRIIDGIIFIVFWTFAVGLVMAVLCRLTDEWKSILDPDGYGHRLWHWEYIDSKYYFPFAPLDYITAHFEKHLSGYMNIHAIPMETIPLANMITGDIVLSLMSAGATTGLFLMERRVKAENVGQISESPFGYKVMIPLFTVCLIAVTDIRDFYSQLLFVIIAIGSFLLTVAYRRTAKIGKRQAIIYAASLAGGILLSLICSLW